jgi:hypothetical protein
VATHPPGTPRRHPGLPAEDPGARRRGPWWHSRAKRSRPGRTAARALGGRGLKLWNPAGLYRPRHFSSLDPTFSMPSLPVESALGHPGNRVPVSRGPARRPARNLRFGAEQEADRPAGAVARDRGSRAGTAGADTPPPGRPRPGSGSRGRAGPWSSAALLVRVGGGAPLLPAYQPRLNATDPVTGPRAAASGATVHPAAPLPASRRRSGRAPGQRPRPQRRLRCMGRPPLALLLCLGSFLASVVAPLPRPG